MHTGLDFRAEYGASVRATAPGRVTSAEYAAGHGKMVEVDHGSGVSTRYAHLSEISVAPGQFVTPNTVLGRVGSTGRSTGAHRSAALSPSGGAARLGPRVALKGLAQTPAGRTHSGGDGRSASQSSMRARNRARAGRELLDVLDRLVPTVDALREGGFHEGVDLAVEHVRGARRLRSGAKILHELVGLEHVGADLVAPADVGLGSGFGARLVLALLQLELVEAGAQHVPGGRPVLVLRALLLAGDDDAGRVVGDADGGIGGVDVVTARARGPIRVDPAVGFLDLDVDAVVDHRIDPDGGEARVPARVRIEGRDAHETMHARLGLEPAIGIVALDQKRRAFDAGLLAVSPVDH